jgi:hypothetical protein
MIGRDTADAQFRRRLVAWYYLQFNKKRMLAVSFYIIWFIVSANGRMELVVV